MNTKTLIGLIVVLVVGIGVYWFSSNTSQINLDASIGSPILPGLYESLNAVDKLELVGAGNNIITTLERRQNYWTVVERNHYPADISKIRSVVVAVAEAKIIEEKTSNKDLYPKLGVEDLVGKEAGGIQINVHYGDQSPALIVGKPGPQINKTRYVRQVDSETSWLVDRKLDLHHDVAYWLQKDILSIEPNEVATVTIVLPDGARLEIENTNSEDDSFVVTNLSDPNSQVINAELNQVTNALSSFQLLDVVSKDQFTDVESSMQVTYTLKNGSTILLTAYEVEQDHYVSIDANIAKEKSESAAQNYVNELRNKTQGWVFKIPNVSYDSMYKREADVLAITEDQLN